MDTIEEIKDFFRKEIINNDKLLQNATHEYLHQLESNIGKTKKYLNEDELNIIEECRDVYRDLLKESEVLNYITYEMFIKNNGDNNE